MNPKDTRTDLARIRSTPWVISRIEPLSALQTVVLLPVSPFSLPPGQALFNKSDGTLSATTKALRNSCLVFPNEQSTQPKSGPNVNEGRLISNAALPSSLSPCLRASTTNSFSAIDGEGGLISQGVGHGDRRSKTQADNHGSPHHPQPSRLPCKRLHLQQLPSSTQRRPSSPQRG